MKTIRVVAAIIIEKGKVLATQRGYGEFKDGWEFPGGKIELGEIPEAAIVREIKEELDTEIEVVKLLDTVEYDYPQPRYLTNTILRPRWVHLPICVFSVSKYRVL